MKGAETLTNLLILLILIVIAIFVILYFTTSATGSGTQNIRMADLKNCCMDCKSRSDCTNPTEFNCYDSVNKTYVPLATLAALVGRCPAGGCTDATSIDSICG